jgi:hypothetical protein
MIPTVTSLRKRLGSVGSLIALVGALWTPCGGWQATAEARLTCCTSDGSCPMHEAETSPATPHAGMTQSEADRCCAATEGSGSSTAGSSSVPLGVAALAVVDGPLSALPPVLAHAHAFPGIVHVVSSPAVHKHLLFSVFLV